MQFVELLQKWFKKSHLCPSLLRHHSSKIALQVLLINCSSQWPFYFKCIIKHVNAFTEFNKIRFSDILVYKYNTEVLPYEWFSPIIQSSKIGQNQCI